VRNYIVTLTLGALIVTGCAKKPKKPIEPPKENNQTIVVPPPPQPPPPPPVIEEPTLGTYDWRANDELITEAPASKIVVVKSKRVLVLFDENDNVLSRHRISLGKNNVGTKLKQGDYKTPEGTYRVIDMRSDKQYYKEILISYPNNEDKERSRNLGFRPGGGITIHAQVPWNWDGHGNDYTLSNDWTEGCVSVTNEGMDTIWKMIKLGTPIEIRE
jgi:murein L,D-transpeptidase YafK